MSTHSTSSISLRRKDLKLALGVDEEIRCGFIDHLRVTRYSVGTDFVDLPYSEFEDYKTWNEHEIHFLRKFIESRKENP